MNIKQCLLGALLARLALFAKADCPSWPTSERFVFNGAEVTDKRSGLVWARCSVGQTWNGLTCTGSPRNLTHEAALQHAASQTGWRLPNVKELASLTDKGCTSPALDSKAFPATPPQWYWSSSPNLTSTDTAWYVYFVYGGVGNEYRSVALAVRLVRSSS